MGYFLFLKSFNTIRKSYIISGCVDFILTDFVFYKDYYIHKINDRIQTSDSREKENTKN